MKKKELKQELKTLAVNIRQLKSQRKQHSDGFVPGLFQARLKARHMHVAYSLMRGNSYEQIEKNPREPVDMSLVEKYMEAQDEAICCNE